MCLNCRKEMIVVLMVAKERSDDLFIPAERFQATQPAGC